MNLVGFVSAKGCGTSGASRLKATSSLPPAMSLSLHLFVGASKKKVDS